MLVLVIFIGFVFIVIGFERHYELGTRSKTLQTLNCFVTLSDGEAYALATVSSADVFETINLVTVIALKL